jgi:DNA-binding CsgD family transcriptional regulator
MAAVDTDLGIFSHGLTRDYPEAMIRDFYARVYPQEAALAFIDQARTGETVTTHSGPVEREHLAMGEMREKLKVVFAEQGRMWGAWCLVRTRGERPFDEQEKAFAALVAPHVAAGLRRAALMEAAATPCCDPCPETAPTAPGVAVYDARGRLVLRDDRASRYLGDLHDVARPGEAPVAVVSAIMQLRWRLQRPAGSALPADDEHASGVRARGRAGQWYAVHASAAESDLPEQAGHTVVVITPLGGGERATILARLYGLSPREREVVVRIARGESGKQIAAALGLSAHTVQAHIDHACTRIGVRGRRELVAKLFVDAQAARLVS